jgi:hypothetical protein
MQRTKIVVPVAQLIAEQLLALASGERERAHLESSGRDFHDERAIENTSERSFVSEVDRHASLRAR